MGRYNFRPARVHQATTELLGTERLDRRPPWYDIVGTVPPAQILVRTQPVEHHVSGQKHRRSKTRKPSKLFQPRQITYPEDRLRREFFGDHPWELARPRIVIEDDGKDAMLQNWETIRSPGRPLGGESVVQRQMYLMQKGNGMTTARAYDQARREFYAERLQEDIERRIAKEEAQATGAYFGMSMLQIGMGLEDKEHERWRQWASEQATAQEQARAGAYTGMDNPSLASSQDDPETQAELDLLEEITPDKGQEAETLAKR